MVARLTPLHTVAALSDSEQSKPSSTPLCWSLEGRGLPAKLFKVLCLVAARGSSVSMPRSHALRITWLCFSFFVSFLYFIKEADTVYFGSEVNGSTEKFSRDYSPEAVIHYSTKLPAHKSN